MIFDIGGFLGITGGSGNDGEDATVHMPRLVVVSNDGCTAGIPVDRALGVIQVGDAEVKSPEVLSGGVLREYLTGELESSTGVVGLLDLPRVLEAARV